MEAEPSDPLAWNLIVDGSSSNTGSGAKIILISLEGYKLNCAIRFHFQASNNVTEYEALLAGLRLSKEIQVKRLFINSDSQLVVSQIKSNFSARVKNMASYLKKVMELLPQFDTFKLNRVPRT